MDNIQLDLDLGKRTYPIFIGRGLDSRISDVCSELRASGRKAVLITDESVAAAQEDFIELAFSGLEKYVVPSGEKTKAFSFLEGCCDFLSSETVDRHGVIFALGGGVVGDLAGFAAASYLRGIDFYQVPTTLLSMVDSSVGGKTGINLKSGKNLVGAFHQPKAVFADVDRLKTLSSREFNSGMAEVIKHGMLGDEEMFSQLERLPVLNPESSALSQIVARNCQIKASVVKADETEKALSGGRALLNLGHTFGHAIEAVAGYGQFLHGEAIAIGLVKAAELSLKLGYVEQVTVDRVKALLAKYSLPTDLPENLNHSDLENAMLRDKKAKAGSVKFVVLKELGQAITQTGVSLKAVWK